jgi:hypothetical protein
MLLVVACAAATAGLLGGSDRAVAGNAPNVAVLAEVVTSASHTAYFGTLSEAPHSTFRVDLYSAATCDGAGPTSATTKLGETVVFTNGAGQTGVAGGGIAASPGVLFSATTTNPLGFTSDFSPCVAGTPCATGADPDCDGYADVAPAAHEGRANTDRTRDNCVGLFNLPQTNHDANFLDLTPPRTSDDLSRPMSDALGDDCDPDDDNDGLSDIDEIGGTGCGPFSGLGSEEADSDGDNYIDGAECLHGTDPRHNAEHPTNAQCGPSTDADGDGILAFRELCFYGTNPNNINSDGDACNDGREMASQNGPGAVDVLDLLIIASASGSYDPPGEPVQVNADLTKNYNIDVLDLQSAAARSGPCP